MNPKELPRRELVGLDVEADEARDRGFEGVSGRVVWETKHTLVVDAGDHEVGVPKQGTTFEFTVDGRRVKVDGDVLDREPADRTRIQPEVTRCPA